MENKPLVIYTDHIINKTVTHFFAKGFDGRLIHINNVNNFDKPIATYGILRGTGEALKKAKDFWYIDHGYFKSSKRSFIGRPRVHNLDGYFRIVHNDYWHSGDGFCKTDRFEKLEITIKPIRKNGEYIILSEPSKHMREYFELGDWVKNTTDEIKKYTDRKIILHSKKSEVNLKTLIKNAWAFVSEQSTAGLMAMLEGVPAHFTNKTLNKINPIQNIESGKINNNIFYNLAYGQWTLKEMESGEAWNFLGQNLI